MADVMQTLPSEVVRTMVKGFSTAVLVTLRGINKLFRDAVSLPEVMVDVVVLPSGHFLPALPPTLPEADHKHLRINFRTYTIWSDLQSTVSEVSVMASNVQNGFDTLHLTGRLHPMLALLRALVACDSLCKTTQVHLILSEVHCICEYELPPNWKQDKSELLRLVSVLPALAVLRLEGLSIDFCEMNRLGNMTSLTSIRANSSIWSGAVLRLPHVLQLHLEVRLRCRAIRESISLFDAESFPRLTHLTLEQEFRLPGSSHSLMQDVHGSNKTDGVNRLLQCVLPHCPDLQSLSVGAQLTVDTMEILRRSTHLHTLLAESIAAKSCVVLQAVTSFKCCTASLEVFDIMPRLTSLELTMTEDSMELVTLPRVVTTLRADCPCLDFTGDFSMVTDLHVFMDMGRHFGKEFLKGFPNVVAFGLTGYSCTYRDLRRYLQALSNVHSPPIRTLTLCLWSITSTTLPVFFRLPERITHLTLDTCNVTPVALQALVKGMPGLLSIDITQCMGITKLQCREVAQKAGLRRQIGFRIVCK